MVVGPPWRPGVAALLSFLIPGTGQIYKGQVLGGLAWLVSVAVGYAMFIFPGLVLHLLCILFAASGSPAGATATAGTNATGRPESRQPMRNLLGSPSRTAELGRSAAQCWRDSRHS